MVGHYPTIELKRLSRIWVRRKVYKRRRPFKGRRRLSSPFPFKAEGQYESLQQPGLKAPKELEEVHQTIVLSLVPVLRSLLDEIEKLANEIGWDTNLPGHTEPCQTGGQQLYGKCFRKESSSINPDYTRATLSHYQLSSFPLSIPKFLKIWTKGIAKGSPFFGRM